MAKGPGGKTPGGKPKVAGLGSGSKGRSRTMKSTGPGNVNTTIGSARAGASQALAGNPDVVARNLAAAGQGKMQQVQLRKNRSTGIKP